MVHLKAAINPFVAIDSFIGDHLKTRIKSSLFLTAGL